jgi:hypothetical protein
MMAIESKTTHTGPLPATLAPMTVDMIGPKGTFGRLDLPEVKTTSKGALINIPDQHIKIIDMAAYLAFVKSIQLDEKLVMMLDHGKGTIKALGMKNNIVYKKAVNLIGMDGPQTQMLKTEVLADGTFKNTMKIVNPSPVEIEMGEVTFGFKNPSGVLLATQKASIRIVRGDTIYEAVGKVETKGSVDRVSIVGLTPEKDSWITETLKLFNVPIRITPEFKALVEG